MSTRTKDFWKMLETSITTNTVIESSFICCRVQSRTVALKPTFKTESTLAFRSSINLTEKF